MENFDPSEFDCIDEHINGEFEEVNEIDTTSFLDYELDEYLIKDTTEHHKHLWEDLSEIDNDDVPWDDVPW